MNKRGQLGSSIITLYRVLMIIVISVTVLGISSLVYSHHINIRDSEAMLLVREISGCVISEGLVDLDDLKGSDDVFEYCGFEEKEMERFYVSVSVAVPGKEVFEIDGGDSGLLWVKDIFRIGSDTGVVDKYRPGHFEREYDVVVLVGGIEKDGIITVEVAANAE